jgi:DNA replication and repair protein RecF
VSEIRRLILSDFRNYTNLDLTIEAPMIALCGENGAGKTNLLEAISLFSAGRGLRRDEFAMMVREGGARGFAVSLEMHGAHGAVQLGAGFDPQTEGGRRCRIDREAVSSPTAFADHCRILWLTPDSDSLFRGAAGDRRRFLDRLVLAIDSTHGSRVNALEKALRSRNRLLEEPRPDAQWLDAVEREVAETAVAVAAARRETVQRLTAVIDAERETVTPFPHAVLALEGDMEAALERGTALAAEEWYRQVLRDNRWRDQAAGRTLIGPNASDLAVRHGPKDMPAERSSTGEQKALLIGLVLAHARLVRQMSGMAPVVLLDEVAAHLDPARRAALYRQLTSLGGQIWMTGTDAVLFEGLPEGAMMIKADHGKLSPVAPARSGG